MKPLRPRTLRWVARQADKERPVLPMRQPEQQLAAALRFVARTCRSEARRIEKRTKKARAK